MQYLDKYGENVTLALGIVRSPRYASCRVVLLIRLDPWPHPRSWRLVDFRPVGPDRENGDTVFEQLERLC